MMDLLPRLRPTQYAGLEHLGLSMRDNDGWARRQIGDQIFHLPSLKTLHLSKIDHPNQALPYLNCASLTTLIVTSFATIPLRSVVDAIPGYPCLRNLILDTDLKEISGSVVNNGIRHLVLGGFDLFASEHPPDELLSPLDLGFITSIFPKISALTLKEVCMVEFGAVRANNIQELSLLSGDQDLIRGLGGKENLSQAIHLFLASVPNLLILRRGSYIYMDNPPFASVFHWRVEDGSPGSAYLLFQTLAEVRHENNQEYLVFCLRLERIEVIRIDLDCQLLESIERNIHLRPGRSHSTNTKDDPDPKPRWLQIKFREYFLDLGSYLSKWLGIEVFHWFAFASRDQFQLVSKTYSEYSHRISLE
jgi:hypothetical protein